MVRFFFERYPQWERTSKIAFIIAFALFVLMLFLGATLPPENRWYAVIGIVGMLVAMQGIFLWANRDMVTEYTKAQRAYLAGDFASARGVLLQGLEHKPQDIKLWTLLGNTYRQMGDLTESERALSQALDIKPDHHFALYGLGRTFLVQGRYADAIGMIERAIEQGAPEIVLVDLGEALYRQEASKKQTIEVLNSALPFAKNEAHRELMVKLLLRRLGEPITIPPELVEKGFPYLETLAQQFISTPYGESLQTDLSALNTDLHS